MQKDQIAGLKVTTLEIKSCPVIKFCENGKPPYRVPGKCCAGCCT